MIDTTKTIREVRYNGTAIPLLGGVDNPIVVTSDAEMETCLNDDRYLGMYVKFSGESENYLNGQVYKIAQEGEVSKFYQLPTLDNEGTAVDLKAGKQLISSSGQIIIGTSEGGSSSGEEKNGKYSVLVVDYDGEVLLETRGNEGDVIKLPSAPIHDRLVFQEWSASCPIVDNSVTITDNDIIAGAIYTTASGKNELVICTSEGLTVNLLVNGTIDWGDGTITTDTTQHTYVKNDRYIIKFDGAFSGTNDQTIFGKNITSPSDRNDSNLLEANFVSYITELSYHLKLKRVSFSKEVTSLGYFGQENPLLKCVVIPSTCAITEDNPGPGYNVGGIEHIVFPYGSTNYCEIYYCQYLKELILPDSIISVYYDALGGLSNIKKLKLPKVPKLGPGAFGYNYDLLEYDFSRYEQVPIFEGEFAYINPKCKIIVPDVLYDEWIAAENWSTYANYIHKVSEVSNE